MSVAVANSTTSIVPGLIELPRYLTASVKSPRLASFGVIVAEIVSSCPQTSSGVNARTEGRDDLTEL